MMGLCDPLMIYIKLYFKRSNERCTHNDIWRYFVEWHEPREAADERHVALRERYIRQ